MLQCTNRFRTVNQVRTTCVIVCIAVIDAMSVAVSVAAQDSFSHGKPGAYCV